MVDLSGLVASSTTLKSSCDSALVPDNAVVITPIFHENPNRARNRIVRPFDYEHAFR